MKRKLLISGDRDNFTTLEFDASMKTLRILANYSAPFNVSWTELWSSTRNIDHLIGISEDDDIGLFFTFNIDHEQQTCQITSRQSTLGAPCHFIMLHDGSALALATYLGSSISLYPISFPGNNEVLLQDVPRTEFLPQFPYQEAGHGPNKRRQQQCHIHHVLEDTRGWLYAPDLGSDRVWILRRDKVGLELSGWLQCPPGSGPRHAVINREETVIYVLGELSDTITAFDLPAIPAESIQPVHGFCPTIIPPTVDPIRRLTMDSAEICLHPTIPNVLYASNRNERHPTKDGSNCSSNAKDLPLGDAVAIVLLSSDGRVIQSVAHVRSNVDFIRGMRISDDGKYAAILGQKGGGVEVYGISGERGDIWTLVAGLSEGLGLGLKHAVWL